ncbi:MAG: hypothetical protein A3K90_06950 [Pelodictyon luteolum]|uniref:Uncharacterized protein n=2 Tax=Pelodictyon luteolum TaxID=1100 RepID=Q3B2Z0_CHLL3|nr:OadG family protein [Pelodictyon luteolum]ABB24291.1 hypothetical protein Plut_1432 [Pelodictyon luteolum DSM 273]KZK73959.1 MAG: hypothetical protein A3K90_06950 [Pelodictyon luteolum]
MFPAVSFNLSAIQADHLMLAATGYGVVFMSLIILYLVFSVLPHLLEARFGKKANDTEPASARAQVARQSGEVNASIAMALHMYFTELHDQETAILTIKKAAKNYSPWNSKIYNVINFKGTVR